MEDEDLIETEETEPEAEAEAEPEETEEVEAEASEENSDDAPPSDTGETQASGDTGKPPKGYVPQEALTAERRKRQEKDRKIQEIEQRLAYFEGATQAQRQAQPVQQQDADEDDSDETYWKTPKAAIGKAAKREAERIRAEMRQEFNAQRAGEFNDRLSWSYEHAVRRYGKDEVFDYESEFKDLAGKHPRLAQIVRVHPDPVEFAYQTVKEYREASSSGTELQRLRAELDALKKGTPAKPQGAKPVPPKSNAGARGAGPRPVPKSRLRDEDILDAALA